MLNLPNIGITNAKDITFISQENIIFCKSEGNYTSVHMLGGENLLSSKNLKDFESKLAPELFFRVHNSFIINLLYITKFNNDVESSVEMINHTKIPISRRKKSQFWDKFHKL